MSVIAIKKDDAPRVLKCSIQVVDHPRSLTDQLVELVSSNVSAKARTLRIKVHAKWGVRCGAWGVGVVWGRRSEREKHERTCTRTAPLQRSSLTVLSSLTFCISSDAKQIEHKMLYLLGKGGERRSNPLYKPCFLFLFLPGTMTGAPIRRCGSVDVLPCTLASPSGIFPEVCLAFVEASADVNKLFCPPVQPAPAELGGFAGLVWSRSRIPCTASMPRGFSVSV